MTAKSSPTCSFVPSRIRRHRSSRRTALTCSGSPMTPSPRHFAQNASAEDLTVFRAVQRPLRFSCVTVPTAGSVLWKKVPSWYLVAEHDHMIVPARQRFIAERMKANIKSHPVDHTPIVTAPGPVVDIIHEAVQSVAGK